MRYNVKVRFNVEKLEERDGEIIIGLSSKPKQGRANRELMNRLASHFEVDPSKVRIVSGLTSKSKIVEIEKEGSP